MTSFDQTIVQQVLIRALRSIVFRTHALELAADGRIGRVVGFRATG